jgi:hypothetical protein
LIGIFVVCFLLLLLGFCFIIILCYWGAYVMVVEKDKEGFLKPQNNTNTSELKEGYKVKIIGHVKGIGDKATMEGNTPEQLSKDLATILPKGTSPRKVSVVGCGSGKCDEGGFFL